MHLIGNRYRIKNLIGEGGMASVYSAIDEKLDRRVAIKILHAHLARNEDIRLRFHQEAVSISGIDHPNIIKVHDFSGDNSEQLWIVTEILYGSDLSEYIQRFKGNRLHPIIASVVTSEICNALEEVHQNGIVHRDIKPENIMVLDSGVIKLMDFGIAKVAASQNATQTGTFMGSPSYMSPEQIKGTKIDVRTDIYSLNILFYEILTGTLPYLGNNTADVINRIITGKYVQPKDLVAELPLDLNNLIVKSLNGDRDLRFPHIVGYNNALEDFLRNAGINNSAVALKDFFKDPKLFFKNLVTAKTHHNGTRATSTKQAAATVKIDVESKPNRHKAKTNYQNQGSKEARSRSNKTMRQPSMILPPSEGKAFTGHSGKEVRNKSNTRKTVPSQMTRHPSSEKVEESDKKIPELKSPIKNIERKTRFEPPAGQKKRSRPVQREKHIQIFIPEKKSDGTFWSLVLASALVGVFVFGGSILKKRRETNKARNEVATLDKGKSRTKVKNSSPKKPIESTKTASSTPRPEIKRKPVLRVEKNGSPSMSRIAIKKKPSSRPKNIRPTGPSPDSDKSLAKGKSRPPRVAVVDPKLRKPEPPAKKDPIKKGPSIVKIASTPAAEIYLDNRLLGTTNDSTVVKSGLNLDPGSYSLTLKRRGYHPLTERFKLNASQTLNLNFTLQKAQELTKLKIESNKLPTKIMIRSVNSQSMNRSISLASAEMVLEIPPGQYKVTAKHRNEKIERTLFISPGDKSLTFSARFK